MRAIAIALLASAFVAGAAAAKPPQWDKRIEGASRFAVLKSFRDEAVLDRETGLVWARSWGLSASWDSSFLNCLRAGIGGRYGWRLPLAHEMASLVDPAAGDLPAGHPFDLPADAAYWTATTAPALDGSAQYAVVVRTGANEGPQAELKSSGGPYALCVRAAGGSDGL